MARNIGRIVDFLLKEVIPTTQLSLRIDLETLMDDIRYLPPERLNSDAWGTLGMLLYKHLGDPDCEWKVRVASIMADKEKIPEEFQNDNESHNQGSLSTNARRSPDFSEN